MSYKALISNTLAIYRPVHAMYEAQNQLRLQNQFLTIHLRTKLQTTSLTNTASPAPQNTYYQLLKYTMVFFVKRQFQLYVL